MAARRPRDEDDPRPRKRKRKGSGRRAVWLAVLGAALLALLVAGVIVVLSSRSPRDRDTGGGSGGGGSGGGSAARPGPGAGAGPDLVVNGSFEDGPEPDPAGPGFTVVEAGSDLIPGWTVTRGSVDYIGPYWQHADGRRSIDLNGNEPGAISQTLRTRPGAKYRVSFHLAGNNCGDAAIKTLVVSAAGRQAEFTFDGTGRTYQDMGWVTRTWEFTAEAAETVLEFASTTEIPVACGPALDRVSVVEVGK